MKRLRSSLTLKIFILTLFLLLAISGITYASVAVFLPKTYRNSLEKDLASVSESLKTELESYASIEEAENFLEFFERNNQASVTVLDKEGNQVFPEVETEVADTVSTGSEESMVVEEDGLVTFSGIAVSDEAAEELGDDTYGVTVSDAGYFTLSTSYPSAVKSYKVTVGGKAYTLLVGGGKSGGSHRQKDFSDGVGYHSSHRLFLCHSGFLVSGTADSPSEPGVKKDGGSGFWRTL